MTWNHAWGAIPAYVISRKICGIEPLEPSFRKIKIHPQPGNLEWAKIKHPTIRGSIELEFKNQTNAFILNLSVPANTNSDVYIPNNFKNYSLLCNGKNIDGVNKEGRILIKDIKAGTYKLELKNKISE